MDPANDTAIPATHPRAASRQHPSQHWYTAEIERLLAEDAAAYPEHATARASAIREQLRGLYVDADDLLAVPVALRVLREYEALRGSGYSTRPLIVLYERFRSAE